MTASENSTDISRVLKKPIIEAYPSVGGLFAKSTKESWRSIKLGGGWSIRDAYLEPCQTYVMEFFGRK